MSITTSTNTLQVVQGNYGIALNFTIQNSDATPANLTGYSVSLNVWQMSNFIFSHPCTVLSPTSGSAMYTVLSTDFPSYGNYYADLQLTQSGILEDTLSFVLQILPGPP